MAEIPDSAKRDAIDILTTYVDFIRNEVRANDFERHPYVPHIEQTIEDLRAAPPAMDREAVERVREAAYRQALEDVCNPLGYLQRMADAEGAKLSGMAYAIASDIGTIQRIAKEALSTLSADAIRQGEGEADRGVVTSVDDERTRAFTDGWIARVDHTDFDMALHYWMLSGATLATPASHASDGGEA